jgi:hypothetical protein
MKTLLVWLVALVALSLAVYGWLSIWHAVDNAFSAQAATTHTMPATCHLRDGGFLPDPACTPGATNPLVTQSDIYSTICKRGWAQDAEDAYAPEQITEPQKFASYARYGIPDDTPTQYDRLIPVDLGGAVDSSANMFPLTYATDPAGLNYKALGNKLGFDPAYIDDEKDVLDKQLNADVCDGKLTLADAQQAIATNWLAAWNLYVPGAPLAANP